MKDKGWTLIEIMIALFILSIILVGVYAFLQNSIEISIREKNFAEFQSDTKLALSVIEQDLKMASFGMPVSCRAASNDSGGIVINSVATDRLFLANGWEIIRDFTADGYEDTEITESSYTKIAQKKGKDNRGGYSGILSSDANQGAFSILLDDKNIDLGDEVTIDDDIRETEAVIMYENSAQITEGHRIASITGNNITLGGSLDNDYPAATSQVVPAIAYYLQDVGNRYWLYRNGSKILADVQDFQVEYGYDVTQDRTISDTEWFSDIPSPLDDPTLLRFVRANMQVKFEHKGRGEQGKVSYYNYEVVGEFRN
ncbi:prepilin-type N-terminal cleavage/methylation domain-containing protein [Patescibacteria group bacterium]|nr:prepilin-type N-terminal cleavage/methylation domain-containing protein [Patescibacteria group bacterium]